MEGVSHISLSFFLSINTQHDRMSEFVESSKTTLVQLSWVSSLHPVPLSVIQCWWQAILSNLLIVPVYSPDKNWVFLPNHSTNQQLYQHMGTSETLSAFVSTLEKTRLRGVRVASFLSCNLEWDYQRCEHFRQQREKHFVRAAAVEVWQKRYGYISPFLKMIRDWERYYDSDNSI